MLWLIFICSLVIIGIGTWKYLRMEIVQVEGLSMFPTYKHGSLVLIKKRLKVPYDLEMGRIYIYKCPKGYPVIKRLMYVEYCFGEAYLWFEGDNKGNSEDSRAYGFVRAEDVEGILVFHRGVKQLKQ